MKIKHKLKKKSLQIKYHQHLFSNRNNLNKFNFHLIIFTDFQMKNLLNFTAHVRV